MMVRALKNLKFRTAKGIIEIRHGQVFKPADPERLIKVGLVEPVIDKPYWQLPDGSCYACYGLESWLSVHGVTVCARCHPPAHDNLVVKWGTA